MMKFASDHRNLEIINYSRPLPATLGSQIINLLSSLGIPDNVFMDILVDELYKLRSFMHSHDIALNELKKLTLIQPLINDLIEKNISPLHEPFFLSILQSVYDERLCNLKKKFRLHVKDGINLMGVFDESGILPEDTIFIQLEDPESGEFKQIMGSNNSDKAIVYRNPCLHPGDVRTVSLFQGKPNDFLSGIRNCVVFSQKGKRSVPSACAGGDLDGDYYTVIWDPRLVVDHSYDPCVFDSQGQRNREYAISLTHIIDFMLLYMNKNVLGTVANAHVVKSDQMDAGACSDEAIQLAELHAIEVDFPKTEKNGLFPSHLKPKSNPDYMEKNSRDQYMSMKIHGKIYRYCLNITWIGDADLLNRTPLESNFLFEGYQNYVDGVRPIYVQYCMVIEGLIRKYGLHNEIEIISGSLLNLDERFKSGKDREKELLQQELKLIWEDFRQHFYDIFGPVVDPGVISACYFVANCKGTTLRCSSFPWILGQALIKNSESRIKYKKSIEEILGESIMINWEKGKSDKLTCLENRIAITMHLNSVIHKHFTGLEAVLFGSSANFMFESFSSDIDICIIGQHEAIDDGTVLEKLFTAFTECDDGKFSGVTYNKSALVPIIEFEYKWNGKTYMADVSCTPASMYKLSLLVPIFDRHPFLIQAVSFLRRILFPRLPGYFNCFGFIWLLLRQLNVPLGLGMHESFFQGLVDIDMDEFFAKFPVFRKIAFQLCDFWETRAFGVDDAQKIGQTVLFFLESIVSGAAIEIPDPAYPDREPCVSISDSNSDKFFELSSKLLHIISKYGHASDDIYSILLNMDRDEVVIHLNKSVEKVYMESPIYQEGNVRDYVCRNGYSESLLDISYESIRAGLLVTLRSQDPNIIHCAEKYFLDFISRVSNLKIMGKKKSHFVEDSVLLLFETGSGSPYDCIKFLDYKGPHHAEHNEHLWFPKIRDLHSGECDSNEERFHQRFQQQFVEFLKKRHENRDLFEGCKIRVIARFGRNYLFNIPTDELKCSLKPVTINDLETSIMAKGFYQPWLHDSEENDKPPAVEEAVNDRVEGEKDSSGGDPNVGKDAFNLQQRARGSNNKLSESMVKAMSSVITSASQSFYTKIFSSSKEDFSLSHQDYIDIILVKSEYRIRIKLDDSMKILNISQRSIRWFAAVFHAGHEENGNRMMEDMRVYLDATMPVAPDDPIWTTIRAMGDEPLVKLIWDGDSVQDFEISRKFNHVISKLRVIRRIHKNVLVDNVTFHVHESKVTVFSMHDGAAEKKEREEHLEYEVIVDDEDAIARNEFSFGFHNFAMDKWKEIHQL